MTPYYDEGGVTIYHGDAREILPKIEADRIITDPVWPDASPLLRTGQDPADLLRETLAEARARTVVIHLGRRSDPRFLAAVPPRWPFLCATFLERVFPTYNVGVLNCGDFAYAFGERIAHAPGRRVIPGGKSALRQDALLRRRGFARDTRTAAEYQAMQAALAHPAPRMPEHLVWLVNWFSDVGDLVVDPFGGSGTTAVACRRLGRRCILIEIEERYCALSVERLAQAALPLEAD